MIIGGFSLSCVKPGEINAKRFNLIAIGCLTLLTACGNGIDPELEAATQGRDVQLGVHLVNEASNNRQTMRIALERGMTPAGTIFLPYPDANAHLIIAERTRITDDCIKHATEGVHPENGRAIMNFSFDDTCTNLFGRLTTENIGKRFAFVSDGKIMSAVGIGTPITKGRGYIGEGFSNMQEAREFAYMLNRQSRARRAAE